MTQFLVQNDWLFDATKNLPVPKIPCAQPKYSSGANVCDYIIFHYTASTSLQSALKTYQAKDTQVSWHLTIDVDGSVCQLLDFRKKAWHAGESNWKRPDGTPTGGLNKWAIGIEMVNPGPLTKTPTGYVTWFGSPVPPKMVFVDQNGKAWYNYTDQQLQAAEAITAALVPKYKCIDLLGHEQISPGRKQDPGPAFWHHLDYLRQKYIGK